MCLRKKCFVISNMWLWMQICDLPSDHHISMSGDCWGEDAHSWFSPDSPVSYIHECSVCMCEHVCSVCMCEHVCVCVFVCIHTHTCSHRYMCIHVSMHECIHTHILAQNKRANVTYIHGYYFTHTRISHTYTLILQRSLRRTRIYIYIYIYYVCMYPFTRAWSLSFFFPFTYWTNMPADMARNDLFSSTYIHACICLIFSCLTSRTKRSAEIV